MLQLACSGFQVNGLPLCLCPEPSFLCQTSLRRQWYEPDPWDLLLPPECICQSKSTDVCSCRSVGKFLALSIHGSHLSVDACPQPCLSSEAEHRQFVLQIHRPGWPQITILLPQSLNYWNYKPVSPYATSHIFSDNTSQRYPWHTVDFPHC